MFILLLVHLQPFNLNGILYKGVTARHLHPASTLIHVLNTNCQPIPPRSCKQVLVLWDM
jgi:hypothetical protein